MDIVNAFLSGRAGYKEGLLTPGFKQGFVGQHWGSTIDLASSDAKAFIVV
jgi:hypothetical protein